MRNLALGDRTTLDGMSRSGWPTAGFDSDDERRAHQLRAALTRIGALVALGSETMLYQQAVNDVLAAGGSPHDILEALGAVAGTVGAARIVSSAPRIALALGYDVEAALEHPDLR